ncbi:MAG: phage tail protein [Waterburya sp.]
MTNSNESSGERLDRIENILDRLAIGLEATRAIANSNSRAIQAMMEQQATDRLKREEEKAEHEQRMARLEDTVIRLTRIEEAQNRMLASMDEDRPTVLRRLMSIENKVDILIERNQ